MTEKMVGDICVAVFLLGESYLMIWFILSLFEILSKGEDS